MISLYDIGTELEQCEQLIAEAYGEITPEVEDRLAKHLEAEGAKLELIGNWTINLDRELEMLQREITRLRTLKDHRRNLRQRLGDLVYEHLKRRDLRHYEVGTRRFSFRKNPPKVEVVGGWNRDEWGRPQEILPDKQGVLHYWRDHGVAPPGFEVVQDTRLVIE